jgi:hypothetical protein
MYNLTMRKIILTNSQQEQILSLYRRGDNLNSIVNQTNIGRKIIKKFLVECGIEPKTKTQLICESIPSLLNKDLLIELYHKDGLSIKNISIKLGTNEQVVKTAFARLNIKTKSTKEAKNSLFYKQHPSLLNKNELQDLYINQKKSLKDISKQLNCSESAIQYALKLHSIPLRSHKEAMNNFSLPPNKRINSKIARNLRTRFWIALNGKSKMVSAVQDLGVDIELFKKILESKFYDRADRTKMTWDNYGLWEIDHIKPLSSFDLTNLEEQKKACHYTNLQPLWKEDNRKKSNNLLKTLPIMYIVCGPSGSGKSWVCDRLVDVNYIPYDEIPKEKHYFYMKEFATNGKPIIYDPYRRAAKFKKQYSDEFDTRLIVIDESADVIYNRLQQRGSKTSLEEVQLYVNKYKEPRYVNNAEFIGTADQVLIYIQQRLKNDNR